MRQDAQPLEPLVERLGKPWEAVSPGISYKRWPCCYCNHRSIGVLLEMLKKHDIKAADVQAIEIGFPPGTDTPLIHMNPQTGLEAKFSIEYLGRSDRSRRQSRHRHLHGRDGESSRGARNAEEGAPLPDR